MPPSATRELFGGAITTTLPTSLIDASDLRQVPDTQEVFLYPDAGISIIVEVLQCVDAEQTADIVKLHFESLVHDNDAVENKIIEVSQLSGESSGNRTPLPIVLSGTQLVRKFNHTHPDELRILLAVYRIQDKNVDLVLSMNIPMKTSDGATITGDQFAVAQETFSLAARSLRIVDYGLFA
ncbi:Mog1p/PsbP-like protein [Fomitopsis serialis]|uniref:Mog1p/PsbP-like protein n=1 Tax=Fomitopsis serialis TaxID=139415 RepID=UPI00200888CD|nr:Mog1p/PsbP-like protein [Neoantrodia serialis]KAH9934884.1 Mog1p/PsbP-like protein [Neoantrodia serialis]